MRFTRQNLPCTVTGRVSTNKHNNCNGPSEGRSSDRLIINDPFNAADYADSKTRAECLKWFKEGLPARCEGYAGPIVIILSKLHEEDKPDEH